MSVMSAVLWLVCAINAAKTIHWRMLRSVLRSPMSFFDSTPLGRILGLFSSDQAQVDENIPALIEFGLKGFIQLFVSLTLIVISVPLVLIFVVPISVIYSSIGRRFMPANRDSRRVVSMIRNISLSTAEEAIHGAGSIRAYGRADGFESVYAKRIEIYTMAWWTFLCTNRWLAARLDLISAGIVFSTTILLLCTQHFIGATESGYVGLAITYALSTTGVLNICTRSVTMLETALIAIERAKEYSFLPSEAPATIEDSRPAESWPEQGAV
ncbi:ATP-binding cassette bilirubin transporter bpt1, partial [Dipsacomyces acuminosporus]